jgi:aryl-alcohol dehydrogenase-like predicted oxidoreductase/NAD-dependent dihydropyrimidine dehydrogenase PreA subunit
MCPEDGTPPVPRVALGSTGLSVSSLCFGTLTVGPLQRNLDPALGAGLFRRAVAGGVNFFDTAEIYGTYPHLAALLRQVPRDELVLASKSFAVGAAEMNESLTRALDCLGTSYLDIFLLHEQESSLTLRGHRQALLELERQKAEGRVREIGLSTHCVAGVRAGAREPLVEVIHPLVNLAGTGIRDGSLEEMLAAIREAHEWGKAIYAMKPLAGGHLASRAAEALAFVRDIPYIQAVALGVGNEAELEFAAYVMAGREVPDPVCGAVGGVVRRLVVEPWCDGCGACVAACQQGALGLASGRVHVDQARCVLCGYCAASCPGFHLKVV